MLHKPKIPKKTNEDGYSLLEILVVLAIMAVLASVVAPRLFSQVDRSKITAAKAQTKSLRLALDTFRLDTGRYPTEEEGLGSLVENRSNINGWIGPYLDGNLPKDPWGNDFLYRAPVIGAGSRPLPPQVISLGSDGEVGGDGDAEDISSSS